MRTVESTDTDLSTPEFMDATGCTYRRLDYWARTGYLRSCGEATPGSGNYRRWPTSEIAVARFLANVAPLVSHRFGGHNPVTPAVLTRLCNRVRRGDEGFVRIAMGVYVDLVEASR